LPLTFLDVQRDNFVMRKKISNPVIYTCAAILCHAF
jgi:hypothetical protein